MQHDQRDEQGQRQRQSGQDEDQDAGGEQQHRGDPGAVRSSQSGPKNSAPQLKPSRTSTGCRARRGHARSRTSQRPLGGGDGVADPRIGLGRHAQRPRRRLEAGLGDMVRVAAGAAA